MGLLLGHVRQNALALTLKHEALLLWQAFDELVLLKRGGRIMYAGPTGHNSQKLIDYFQAIPDVPSIEEGINPGEPLPVELQLPSPTD